MKKVILIGILVASLGVAGYTFYESWRLQDPEYQRSHTIGRTGMLEIPLEGRKVVALDRFVAETRPRKEGTREIIAPDAIQFSGTIMRAPEAIEVEYVYTALSIMKVEPLPKVGHRMFVEAADGNGVTLTLLASLACSNALTTAGTRA